MDESPPAPHPPPTAHDRSRRIVREPDDRRIAGVCSGLADHLGIDVTVMRVTAVVLALVTHLALIAYLVASVALPERPADQPRVRAQNVHLGQVPHPLIVVGAIVAVAVLVDDAWWLEPFPAAVALVGIGDWLVVVNREEVSLGGRTPGPGGGSDISGAEASHGRGDGGVAGDDSDPDSDPSVTPSPDAAPEDAPTASDVMPAGPGVVSVSQHSSTVGDADTTLTDERSPVPTGPRRAGA